MICCLKEDSLQKIWRLRLNWIYFMAIASLYAISYTSISASFHQLIINPTYQQLNYSNIISPGLGQSELFYSWVIAIFNIGALFGAVGTGFLIKYIPYWHLILAILASHTVGYVLYAISYEGWVIMVSKFLSGIFIGGEMTLALSYFAESSTEYRMIWKQMGEKCEAGMVRRKLFAWHNIGVGIGYILGPGAAAVLAQFEIDQFRSIAWFNVAFGVAFMILQVVIFRGESSFKKTKSKCAEWKCGKFDVKITSREMAISSSCIMHTLTYAH